MRHLVYLLLVVNLVFLGWNLFESRAPQSDMTRAVSPLPVGVSRLTTLEEQQTAEENDAAVSDIETLTTEQPSGAGAALVCQALGPFAGVDGMQSVTEALTGMGLQPVQRQVESKELIGFWVYLPAMSRAEVREVTAVLKDYNDKEYYVGKGNFISLGTFKSRERAERRLQMTRKMGLDATLEERFSAETAFWLDIESDGGSMEQLQGIARKNASLQLVDLACY